MYKDNTSRIALCIWICSLPSIRWSSIAELGKVYLSYLQGDEFLPGLSVLATGYNDSDKVSSVLSPRIKIGVIMGILLCYMNTYLTKIYLMVSGL